MAWLHMLKTFNLRQIKSYHHSFLSRKFQKLSLDCPYPSFKLKMTMSFLIWWASLRKSCGIYLGPCWRKGFKSIPRNSDISQQVSHISSLSKHMKLKDLTGDFSICFLWYNKDTISILGWWNHPCNSVHLHFSQFSI